MHDLLRGRMSTPGDIDPWTQDLSNHLPDDLSAGVLDVQAVEQSNDELPEWQVLQVSSGEIPQPRRAMASAVQFHNRSFHYDSPPELQQRQSYFTYVPEHQLHSTSLPTRYHSLGSQDDGVLSFKIEEDVSPARRRRRAQNRLA